MAKCIKSTLLLFVWSNVSPAHTVPSHWLLTCIHAYDWTMSTVPVRYPELPCCISVPSQHCGEEHNSEWYLKQESFTEKEQTGNVIFLPFLDHCLQSCLCPRWKRGSPSPVSVILLQRWRYDLTFDFVSCTRINPRTSWNLQCWVVVCCLFFFFSFMLATNKKKKKSCIMDLIFSPLKCP